MPGHLECFLALTLLGNPCRFAAHQCLETLFDWVDITVAPDTRPGGYTLVTQYPRRQLQPQSAGTLHEAGLTEKQEALFLNMT